MSGKPSASTILLVDDDETFRSVMSGELSRRGHTVTTAADGREAIEEAVRSESEVILLDLRLPDMDGIQVLEKLRERDVAAGVIVLTGHGTIDTAIRAIRLGAYDYLEKPCPIEKVEMAIEKTREHLRLLARERVLQDGYSPRDVRTELIGASAAFQRLRETVKRIAQTDSTTLILGETGVGKEMVATLLHTESQRKDAPFIVVDCAGLHEELLQSELFGHEKGAFTGASRLRHGLFEVAHGGSLFLDEIGDTSPDVQANLLRVLETGCFRRVGGAREINVDVRVVSATNRNLEEAIEKGRFREDLYFRLSTLTIEIPPLRQRAEDIPLLVDHFAQRFNQRFGRACRFGPRAMERLGRYEWPGNVRELIHAVEQAIVLADGDLIHLEDLPPFAAVGAARRRPGDAPEELPSLREVERGHVLSVLESVGGNRARAARILDISERNLYRLIRRYGQEEGSVGEQGDQRLVT